jgi:phage terminase large subunit-like protein
MDETLAFYDVFEALDPTPFDRAVVALNDLFYLLVAMCGRRDAIHPWIFQRVRDVEAEPDNCLDLWARGHYKNLDVHTPILTTEGWKSHGELKPGDRVFCPDGSTSPVVATRHFTDGICYRVTFCNGISIVAGAGHLWPVSVTSRKRVPGTFKAGKAHGKRQTREPQILTTEQMLERLQRDTYRPAITVTEPLAGVKRNLPVDPYTLGAWLGDGYSRYGAICGIDHEVFREIERRSGVLHFRKIELDRHPDYRVARVECLTAGLRSLGLINNKRIPEAYLTADEESRRALLWGLIDTDGSVGKANACVTFANTNRRLAEDVQTLANSLGYKARLTPARTSNSWQVTFVATARDPHPPCFLPRKQAMLKHVARHLKSQSWYVTKIERVETVATNCIQIEAEHGLYLAGKELIPTHNSTIITFAKIIQDVLADPELTVGIFSYSRQTAQKFLSQIMQELQRNEALKACFPDVLYWNPERESPRWSLDKGILLKRKSNPKEATVEAWGLVEGQPTGVHFKLLNFDDMIEQRNVTNPEQILRATEAWELSDNLGVGDGTIKRYVGTRYALGDTYQTMIDRKVVKVRLHPATHNGREDGKPVFLSQDTWDKKRIEQRSTLAAQMLQNPAAGKQAIFEMAWFRFYEVRPHTLNVYIMADPSRGRTTRSDRTAMAVIGIDSQGNKYLLDGARHRMKLSERWAMLRHFRDKWSAAPGVQMVRVGYERYGQQSDDEYFQEQMLKLEDADQFAIEELAWPNEGSNSKKDRVQRLQPDFEKSKFFLPPIIRHPDLGDCYWRYNQADVKIDYLPTQGLTRAMRLMEAQGQSFRVPKPLTRRDEEGNIYDLTWALMEEMTVFPFGAKDDLVDATSRIYDMQPMPAIAMDRISPEVQVFTDS